MNSRHTSAFLLLILAFTVSWNPVDGSSRTLRRVHRSVVDTGAGISLPKHVQNDVRQVIDAHSDEDDPEEEVGPPLMPNHPQSPFAPVAALTVDG